MMRWTHAQRNEALGLRLALAALGLGLLAVGLAVGAAAGEIGMDGDASRSPFAPPAPDGLDDLDQGLLTVHLPLVWDQAGREALAPATPGDPGDPGLPTEVPYTPVPTREPEPTDEEPEPSATPRPTEGGPTVPPPTPLPSHTPPIPKTPQAAAPGQSDRQYKSGPVQTTLDGRHVWVANAHSDVVSRVDTSTWQTSNFPLPRMDIPHGLKGLSVSDDGREVWVAAHDTDRIFVLNGSSGALKSTIELPWGSGPYSVSISPPDPAQRGVQLWALVTLHRGKAVAAIEVRRRTVHILEDVWRSPFGIGWTDQPNEAWVTHLHPDGEHPRLTRIEILEGEPTVTSQIRIGAATPRNGSQLRAEQEERNIPEGGYLNFRGHPALQPLGLGGRKLWIPTQYHNFHNDLPYSNSIIQATLRRLDLDTKRLRADDKVVLSAKQVHDPLRGDNNPPWIGYGWDAGVSGLVDMGFSRVGDQAYALTLAEQSDELVVMPWDAPMWRSQDDPDAPGLPELRLGHRPMGLAVSPNRAEAYVLNTYDFDLSVIDLRDPMQPVQSGRIALAQPDSRDPLAKNTTRQGAILFYTSADPRISGNEKVSCASCHINGEHDGRSWNFEHLPRGTHGQGHGPRNVQTLRGLYLTYEDGQRDADYGWGQLHHSGDRDEIADFDHTFAGIQMQGTGFLGDAIQPELGAPNRGRSIELDSMAAYINSLAPLWRSPHREGAGQLSDSAVRGAEMFMSLEDNRPGDAQCAACHVPESNFLDHKFHDVGSRGEGNEQELNDGSLRGECLWCVNTASLIGIWDTSPWDGIAGWASSMQGVIGDFASAERRAQHGRSRNLAPAQQADLAAFVLSIDGNTEAAEVRAARDETAPRLVRVEPASNRRLVAWFSEALAEEGLENPENFRLIRARDGEPMPILGVEQVGRMGNRIEIATELEAGCGSTRYMLEARAGVRDLAGWVSGRQSNQMDYAAPTSQAGFQITPELSIRLGASGDSHLIIPVHDAGMVGSGLSTWSHDGPWLHGAGGSRVTGFVRWQWLEPFMDVTRVSQASAIRSAAFSIGAQHGDAQPVIIRRVLQTWSDPASGGYWNRNANGAPTWRDHEHPNQRWNQAGANALGTAGDKPSDYQAQYDLADAIDAESSGMSINGRLRFEGDRIAEAFRFWFDNPEYDNGYGLRLKNGNAQYPELSLFNWEYVDEDYAGGPMLELSYRLPGTEACP